ncbi:hypothetical protein RHGRI_031549 [Rhododendron griersonianum]|uniref:Uncharacterized protein n=1 Tax=Rhododendron griersonianum TaxID=479676 RepID=A0AAV6I889_9ERIC|nr:hypothetical protein RHGRI_031549 [Rhododendron griersonianum]
MLHRNTNRLTLILIYTVLEWILINNPPPPQHPAPGVVASTTSSIPRRTRISSDLLCESHAREISELGYCSNHHKLSQSQTARSVGVEVKGDLLVDLEYTQNWVWER